MGIRRQQWHAVAALAVAWCCAAAAAAVAAADGRNASLAGAAAPEETGVARQQHGDGKAYHHVWPVTNAYYTATPLLIHLDVLLVYAMVTLFSISSVYVYTCSPWNLDGELCWAR
jgi:hypothetical protein